MSQQDYKLKSAATVGVGSRVKVKTISPRHSHLATCGFTLSREGAIQMARNLLVVATDPTTDGDIVITAHRSAMSLTINNYYHYQKSQVIRDTVKDDLIFNP